MTLRQALSGQWQIPLFLVSLMMLGSILWYLRPKIVKLTFEEQYQQLELLAHQGVYGEFYHAAELLRQKTKTTQELGRVHGLTARTRVNELRQRQELEIDTSSRRGAKENYEAILRDYVIALRCNEPDPNTSASNGVYRDLSLIYWKLKDDDMALACLRQAIALHPGFDPSYYRQAVEMLVLRRKAGYLEEAEKHLDLLLKHDETSPEDRAWAFVKKQGVIIAAGREQEALAALEHVDPAILESSYADEIEFLRGSAWRREGRADEAELILRGLMGRMQDRGDVYAQTALELGRINFEQNRDGEAARYYQMVVDSQLGKDWYAAGKLGLAECASLQQRYEDAASLYQEAVELLQENPYNRAIDAMAIQKSLEILEYKLSVLEQYGQALPFMEIEQLVVAQGDVRAAERFARLHASVAATLARELEETRDALQDKEPTSTEALWLEQQQQMVVKHFEQAAEHFIKVMELSIGNDTLYAESLWEAATCYDKAGNAAQSIELWKRYCREREGKATWPQAVFYLAQALQANGQYNEAIEYYELLRKVNPKSPAAFDGIVPLAHCYLVRANPDYDKAVRLLQDVLRDRTLTPNAPYFRQAMFALGELRYKTKAYDAAINILTEAIDRYQDAAELGKSMFLVGDSYRKSGLAMDEELARLSKDPAAAVTLERRYEIRRQHLEHAREYFDRAVKFYEKFPDGRRGVLDNLYLRCCYMNRADCLFDLGQYSEAIQLYELTSLRYQLTPTALMALQQVINCYLKLGNMIEARSASERARWQLRKMKETSATQEVASITRNDWEKWLDWVNQSGMW